MASNLRAALDSIGERALPDELDIVHTHDFGEACRRRDDGYEPVECAFGQHGSVLGPLALDHHGQESHREGVALRACRDHFGERREDRRFVVTGTPDADAVLAIIALAALVPRDAIPPTFYELVDRHDVDPIGLDLMAEPLGERLVWFNQREGVYQSNAGFRKAIRHMIDVLEHGLDRADRGHVQRLEKSRRRKAREGVRLWLDPNGDELPLPNIDTIGGRALCRGEQLDASLGRVLAVKSAVWGFDQWYRLAPVVVSYASRMAKVTIGCPDRATAERIFGAGGLLNIWPELGRGWGGRETIGGSPRGQRLNVGDVDRVARDVAAWLRAR